MANFKKIQQAMKTEGLQALLLINEIDRLYAATFHTTDGAILVFPESAFYITDSRYIEVATESVKDAAVLMSSLTNSEDSIIKNLLAEKGVTELGVEEDFLSYGKYLSLEKTLGVKFVPAQKIVKTLREVKDRYEVESMIAAQRIAEKALDYVLGFIRPGMTEQQVAAELEYRMALGGAQGLAFETICVAGANSSRPHGVPGSYKLQKGDFITMDYGCKINGYCSDMTRTVALGSVTEEMRRVYAVVLEAQLAGCANARPGIIGRDLDKTARDVIEKAGYGQYFGHSLGHSVGLYIHENPNAAPKESRPLPQGAVITSEPGIYLPGKFGVRIEDMLYLVEGGAENLTKAAKELLVL
ncbi:MAG: aminopeptidase P family protein [Oscillospiraceae bacterium]